MTALEAFNQVEQALDALNLRDRWGEPIRGLEAGGIIGNETGKRWDDLLNRMGAGAMTPEQYLAGYLDLIREFQRMQFTRKIDSRLADLKADQVRLNLLNVGAAS